MAPLSYTNDAHLDIAYLLVFKRISLQKRIQIRIVCRRWRDIIEADCARMTTLRLFGRERNTILFPRPKTRPTLISSYKPGYITLNRPSFNRDDISFLLRLFPAIENLTFSWPFDEDILLEIVTKLDSFRFITEKETFDETGIKPGIFALLHTWAPNLRELHLGIRWFNKRHLRFSNFGNMNMKPTLYGSLWPQCCPPSRN